MTSVQCFVHEEDNRCGEGDQPYDSAPRSSTGMRHASTLLQNIGISLASMLHGYTSKQVMEKGIMRVLGLIQKDCLII